MEFISKELDAYCRAHTEAEPELLQELSRITHLRTLKPRMLSGHLQGRFLSMLSHMIRPKDILEIGTFTGYSVLCLAEGLAEGGHLLTIDKNEELGEFVQSFIKRSSFTNQIKCLTGDALNLIPNLKRSFDLVFVDADKANYISYYHLLFDKIRPGGYLIFDNVLWSGKVLGEIDPKDTETSVLHELNKLIAADVRVQPVLLPLRDGLLIVRKC